MKLIQWWLVHRVPIDMIITPTVVSATATANAKPASFTITEEVKKKLYEAALVISPRGF